MPPIISAGYQSIPTAINKPATVYITISAPNMLAIVLAAVFDSEINSKEPPQYWHLGVLDDEESDKLQ